MPGMFAQTMMFGAAATISAVAADKARGVTDRFRSMPMAWALLFPLTMISNTFVSPSLMPPWLGTIAEWNPLPATVAATRELFGNNVPELVGTSWPAQNALLLAVALPVLIVAVFLPLAVRRYHSAAR